MKWKKVDVNAFDVIIDDSSWTSNLSQSPRVNRDEGEDEFKLNSHWTETKRQEENGIDKIVSLFNVSVYF